MKSGEVRKFDKSNVNMAPGTGGIYCIYDETARDMPAYLGRSKNIRQRLKTHLSGRGSKSVSMLMQHKHNLWFSFSYSSNPHGSEAAELARLSPSGNRKREIKYLEDLKQGNPSQPNRRATPEVSTSTNVSQKYSSIQQSNSKASNKQSTQPNPKPSQSYKQPNSRKPNIGSSNRR